MEATFMKTRILTLISVLGLAAGCGDKTTCSTAGEKCDNDKFCEEYIDSGGSTQTACFAPTTLKGKITNAQTGAAVQGARVVPIDADSRAAAGPVGISDADGKYEVRIIAPRQSGVTKQFTLRVSASGYQEFPSGVRVAIPIAVTFADAQGVATIMGPQDIALIPLAQPVNGSIAGAVSGTYKSGVLVVACEMSACGTVDGAAWSTVTDSNGDYVIFNVPDGTYDVHGYFVGYNYTPATGVAVAGGKKDGVNLSQAGGATAVLLGTLSYVAGADSARETTVVLRLPTTKEVPPGLQVKASNSVQYMMPGVPDGTYQVVASYPNDMLVKDPDPGQAGTTTPLVTFAGAPVDVGTFKITDPVNIIEPDANMMVAGNPTFKWTAYPQTYQYKVEVFDSQGTPIWQPSNLDGSMTMLPYAGPVALQPGFYYQWKITSFAQPTASNPVKPISSSEDLRGVWIAQ
jgi:hypothetical protein